MQNVQNIDKEIKRKRWQKTKIKRQFQIGINRKTEKRY